MKKYHNIISKEKKIAIVYDWIDKWGGVERILLALHSLFPNAHYFTSYYNKNHAPWAKEFIIFSSFIDKLPYCIKSNRIFSFLFYPFAFETFDFSDYDIVISITSSFAKSVITKTNTIHICYLLTPTRYLWVCPKLYISSIVYFLLHFYRKIIKNWDYVVSQRPDIMLSLSNHVAKRSLEFYDRESEVVYPPFDIAYWNKIKITSLQSNVLNKLNINNKFWLLVSRLEPYKKIDLAIKAFNKLNQNLIIIGKGSQRNQLKSQAGNTIFFLQDISDYDLAFLYKKAEALIMPQEEDFGYVALEAQYMGCPVISYNKGGALETVVEEKTGLFFSFQSVSSIIKVLEKFDQISYNLKCSTQKYGETQCKKFDITFFQNRLFKIIKQAL